MISRLFKSILLLVNFLLIGLLLLGYLSGSVSPEVMSFFTLVPLLFPIIVFFNVLAVLVWILLRKYYFLFSLFVLIVGYGKIINTISFPIHKDEEVRKADFSLLSYNVRLFDLYNWSHNKSTRNQIFETIRKVNPDIACFQEYFNNTGNYFPVHDSLMENQRFNYAHLYYSVSLSNNHNFGIATYSVYPIVRKDVLVFDDSQNQVLISDIKINNDTVRLFNCHLESVRFLKEDYQFMDSINKVNEARRKQGVKGVVSRLSTASKKRAKQAELIANKIQESPYPVVVCGDFNDVPSSYVYQTIAKNLSDSHTKKRSGIGGTYSRFFPSNRIDYILYDNNLQCIDFERKKIKLSDHYPIFGTYAVVQ